MDDTRQLDRSDRIGMYLNVVLLVVGVVITIVAAVARLIEVGDGADVPVTVPLMGETAPLPLGPEGAAVEATVETATVVVPDPAPATLFALYAQPVWMAVVICAGLALAAILFLRFAQGRAFSGGTPRLALMGAGIVAVGWVGATILTNMTTNGALSALSDYTYESVTFELSFAPVVAILVLGAVAAALQIGERLQRDTEGLV